MKTERFRADYIASTDDIGDPPDETKYYTITGHVLDHVVAGAQRLDINGECYNVCRDQYVDDRWVRVSHIDPWSMTETFI